MTEKEIHTICRDYRISNYTINDDMSIDVRNDVYLSNYKLTEIPLKFNTINGSLKLKQNYLISLKGMENINVIKNFDCSYNGLTTLEGMPHTIGGDIYCEGNYIKSFKGIPEDFNEIFMCGGNPIYDIFKLFKYNSKCIYWINEYDVIQGDNIILERLEEVFHQLNIPIENSNRIDSIKEDIYTTYKII